MYLHVHASSLLLCSRQVGVSASAGVSMPVAAGPEACLAIQAQLHPAQQVELLQSKLAAQQLATEKADLEKAALVAQLRAEQNSRAQLASSKQPGVQDSAQPGSAVQARVAPSQVCNIDCCSRITWRNLFHVL